MGGGGGERCKASQRGSENLLIKGKRESKKENAGCNHAKFVNETWSTHNPYKRHSYCPIDMSNTVQYDYRQFNQYPGGRGDLASCFPRYFSIQIQSNSLLHTIQSRDFPLTQSAKAAIFQNGGCW